MYNTWNIMADELGCGSVAAVGAGLAGPLDRGAARACSKRGSPTLRAVWIHA